MSLTYDKIKKFDATYVYDTNAKGLVKGAVSTSELQKKNSLKEFIINSTEKPASRKKS